MIVLHTRKFFLKDPAGTLGQSVVCFCKRILPYASVEKPRRAVRCNRSSNILVDIAIFQVIEI